MRVHFRHMFLARRSPLDTRRRFYVRDVPDAGDQQATNMPQGRRQQSDKTVRTQSHRMVEKQQEPILSCL